jgi:hypothetical protein
MGSLRQELYFGICLIYEQWEALMLLKLANYHNLLNYQFGPIGIILVTIGMFLKLQQYLSILGA